MSVSRLLLDANEGGLPSTGLLGELARAPADLLRRYPVSRPLEELLAARLGIAPERVIATNGSNDALDRIMRIALAGRGRMVLPVPAFSMLARFASLAGGRIVEVPWLDEPFPFGTILRRCGRRTALLVLTSPNNPTGAVIDTPQLVELIRAVPDTPVLLDLAYVEFADDDPTPRILDEPNAVIVRTLSKAWGLAGLRVGYAAGPVELIGRLRLAGQNYPVAGPSAVLAALRLERDETAMQRYVAGVRRERTRLESDLRSLGARPLPSQANFVTARFTDAGAVHRRLAERGVAVRRFDEVPALASYLRLTCPGNDSEFSRLLDALHALRGPAEPSGRPDSHPDRATTAKGVRS